MTTATKDTLSNPLNFLALTVLPAVGSSKIILGVSLGFPHLKGSARTVRGGAAGPGLRARRNDGASLMIRSSHPVSMWFSMKSPSSMSLPMLSAVC